MSALRVGRPGEPVRLIDMGPAVGRITHTRAGIKGGAYSGVLVVGTSERDRANAASREWKAKNR